MTGEPPDRLNEISEAVIGASIDVHRELGPGLLEDVYQQALLLEMRERELKVQREADLPIHYKGHDLDGRYRIDFLVEDEIVLETKAIEEIDPVHERQLLTYLKLADRRLGLLVNFGAERLVDGLHRVVR